ncbi:hypothetical protein B0T19DRAFT_440480 [Cercophora scortea]|uniref:Uncharacterized protein n=1 Tax=Cercophora scortea TaxID=314031 RepID=A0AAE0IYX3_9PEZI|nr:hypothetical protein B0T19DRAFT_440480 [Cercophora scortea]
MSDELKRSIARSVATTADSPPRCTKSCKCGHTPDPDFWDDLDLWTSRDLWAEPDFWPEWDPLSPAELASYNARRRRNIRPSDREILRQSRLAKPTTAKRPSGSEQQRGQKRRLREGKKMKTDPKAVLRFHMCRRMFAAAPKYREQLQKEERIWRQQAASVRDNWPSVREWFAQVCLANPPFTQRARVTVLALLEEQGESGEDPATVSEDRIDQLAAGHCLDMWMKRNRWGRKETSMFLNKARYRFEKSLATWTGKTKPSGKFKAIAIRAAASIQEGGGTACLELNAWSKKIRAQVLSKGWTKDQWPAQDLIDQYRRIKYGS